MDDYTGTTISLTNVGGLGTNNSVPRLMAGQSAIIGVGSMDYPPEFQGASEELLTRNAVSRILTITSTYDHRVIQRSEEHTSELQSLMRISYAVFCLKNKIHYSTLHTSTPFSSLTK